MKYLLATLIFTLAVACESLPTVPPIPGVSPSPTPVPGGTVLDNDAEDIVALPFMKSEWSKYLLSQIKLQLANLNKASKDMKRFCPRYEEMNIDEQVVVWGHLSSAILKYESGIDSSGKYFKTCSSMTESNGIDSIGFFQLSYKDPYPSCPKSKSEGNLCEPNVNMKCAVNAMGKLAALDKVVAGGGYQSAGAPPPKGLSHYWSVLRVPDPKPRYVNGKKYFSTHHLSDIMALTAKAPGCK